MSKIENLTLEDVMGDRFARYSKSIIQERALPDIRDGLKPVQRRILYAMNKDGNTYDKGFRKSAKSVGNVMGNFHPHGDSSIYEALVRMSQDWKVREPLIEMHGNNGSMDGDPPAAMRYTEARLSKIAGEMLRDIDQETVDWVLNFDDTEYEPTVLPARFPNLLVNGSTGISAGYATDIPPHNLGEVIDAILYLQKHPDASTDKLMEFVAGPDFPTGGIVQGLDGIRQAYETGHGRVVVRSKTEIKSIRGNKSQIVITEIPYEVNKAQLVKRIDEIRINKKIDGIAEVRDESDRDGLTIVVELKRDVDSNGILNYLFKNTDLQVSYTFNMVAINHMRPERVSLKTMLISYLEFQQEVIKKRTIYDLKKAQDRQHIVQGLIKALSILDQVIKTIRASKNRKDARDNLVKAYEFSTVQADAIVALQLYRLTNTDVTQLEKEAADLAARIEADQLILIDDNELNRILAKELKQISKQFRQPRMTEIQAKVADLKISKTVTVPDEDVIVLVSQQGYLKRSSIRSYTASNGEENGLQDFDHPVFLAKVNTRDHLLMFTNKGNLIYRPVFEISDVRWKDTGEHLSQTVGLESDEMVIATYSFKSLKETGEFLIATDDGYIKRVAFESLTPGRTYKKHAFVYEKLKTPTAKVINVTYLPQPTDDMSVMLISHLGYALRFDLAEIPVNGARTTGVKSMNLSSDWVTNVQIVSEDQSVGLITQRGAFKKMKVSEVAPTSRARKGVLVLRELKNDPHRVVDFTVINQLDAPLVVYTDHSKEHDLLPNEFSNGGRYSNGSFVIDVNAEGQPISIQPKLLELIIN